MKVLGIETSCDDTGVAIYDSDQGLLINRFASQVDIHSVYGGVVPELAARDHIRKVMPLVESVLDGTGLGREDNWMRSPILQAQVLPVRFWLVRPWVEVWRLP